MTHDSGTRKNIRLGDVRRALLMDALRQRLGLVSDSELVRRLVDKEADRLGLVDEMTGPLAVNEAGTKAA